MKNPLYIDEKTRKEMRDARSELSAAWWEEVTPLLLPIVKWLDKWICWFNERVRRRKKL